MKKMITQVLLSGILSVSIVLSANAMQIPNVPQIPAFLPTVDQVPATQAMPLDGTWLIPSIGKKIRIEGGRGYAVDGWLHLFVLQVQPGMVVLKNITATAPGKYSGEDLPLMGGLTATIQADRSISVTVAGVVGQANYKLMPVQLDNPQWFAQEMAAAGLAPKGGYQPQQPPAYQPAPPAGYYPQPPPQQGYQPQQPPAYQPPPQQGYQPQQPPAYQPPPQQGYQPQQPPAYQPPPQHSYQPPANQAPPANSPSAGGDCNSLVYDAKTDSYDCK